MLKQQNVQLTEQNDSDVRLHNPAMLAFPFRASHLIMHRPTAASTDRHPAGRWHILFFLPVIGHTVSAPWNMSRATVCLCVALALVCAPAAATMYTETVVISNPSDLIFAGGASFSAAPLASIRSGNPGQSTTASFVTPLNPGATLRAVEFDYRYDTGFGASSAPPSPKDSNFSIVAAGTTVFTSPPLRDFSYGANRTNYSNPIPVTVSGLSAAVPADGPASYFEISFENNAFNMQLLLPMRFSLTCEGLPCHKSPLQALTLEFEPPNIVSGPAGPTLGGELRRMYEVGKCRY